MIYIRTYIYIYLFMIYTAWRMTYDVWCVNDMTREKRSWDIMTYHDIFRCLEIWHNMIWPHSNLLPLQTIPWRVFQETSALKVRQRTFILRHKIGHKIYPDVFVSTNSPPQIRPSSEPGWKDGGGAVYIALAARHDDQKISGHLKRPKNEDVWPFFSTSTRPVRV